MRVWRVPHDQKTKFFVRYGYGKFRIGGWYFSL